MVPGLAQGSSGSPKTLDDLLQVLADVIALLPQWPCFPRFSLYDSQCRGREPSKGRPLCKN